MLADASLTETCHLEVNQGIAGDHSGPRNFAYPRGHQNVATLPELSTSATFGTLRDQIG